ncbi:N-myristoyl transferase [Athelia psychrophila]|uniref:Glycylpeptide N-tetradecanoyltransferase n=1 Tax=Athelia psychrophila TaxID=1759441 RepID=A0A166BF10_9AGAM|nr:N-myristoyl transferase [Fibularhizoctonia sp. CBS 109695]
MASEQAETEEIINAAQDSEHPPEDSESEASDDEAQPDEQATEGEPLASTSSKKKKKKKKSKAVRALNALRGKAEIPQEVVDQVLDKVKLHGGVEGLDAENVRTALEQMKIMEVMKGKTGIGGKNKKDMGEHKFWATQPVQQMGEKPSTSDGCIEPSVSREQVRQDAYPLPKEFEWCVMDLDESKQIKEVYDLLSLNYVEDDDASFRFQYSAEFLNWALRPPGYHKEWHIGVRVSSNKKLVAFISGVPLSLCIRENTVQASEINYLCIHKKLRSKRLAPVLIKEVTRQCHLKGVFQAIYTAGVVLPTPVTMCRYYHRSLNIPKLVSVGFTHVPRSMTLARMIRHYKLPSSLYLGKNMREMEVQDVAQVSALYTRYMQRFTVKPTMTEDEIRHQFLSGKGTGEKRKEDQRREGQVVWTYVIENPTTHDITDFFSFYSLPSTIINQPKYGVLEAAYLFYYATDVAFDERAEEEGRLKKRLQDLIGDALILADQCKFDVFNALTLMDNVPFLQDLKFGAGDGLLNFYLYNWRTAPVAGMEALDGVAAGKGVGVVML